MSLKKCYAYLNAKILPVPRGKFFETPLDDALRAAGTGFVEGGGTLCAADGEIQHCGIDLAIQPTSPVFKFVCDFLTRRGAPRGSKLQITVGEDRHEVPFGGCEGIAVYLNGTDLPAEVYRTSDVNVVMEAFYAATKGRCMYRNYWRGPRETALYMYGPSAAELTSLIAPFMADYPLCQQARVVQIA